jgi:5-methylcytosine-specific restriction enzyme A
MNMSGKKFSGRLKHPRPEDIIAVQDVLLEHILTHRWSDYRQFARTLTFRLLEKRPTKPMDASEVISSLAHPFYQFNRVKKNQFLEDLPLDALVDIVKGRSPSVSPVAKTKTRTIRKPLGAKLRLLILERDHFKCQLCGKTAKETRLEVDHIVPVARGGKDSLENLHTICFDCNRGKSDLSLNIP